MNDSLNTGATTTGSASLAKSIMKPWHELSEAEKVETLRNEIRKNRHLIRKIISLQEDVNRLKAHTHDGFGQVVVPMHTIGATLGSADVAMMHDSLA